MHHSVGRQELIQWGFYNVLDLLQAADSHRHVSHYGRAGFDEQTLFRRVVKTW
jgi:hypothetical protein